MNLLPQCLTIAGSDSGGGAGIQADLKAFHANGAYGLSVLTSITAQNTVEVTRAFDLPLDIVRAQLEAVFSDFDIAALKTGMLSSAALVREVAGFLHGQERKLVVDPVMISKSGFPLLAPDAVSEVRDLLLPLAMVVTPNRHEAELLSGIKIESRDDLYRAGRKILGLGPRSVLIKGGHLDGPGFTAGEAPDYLFAGREVLEFRSERYDTTSTHGTGCTYSAAIAAHLARGSDLVAAIAAAKSYIAGAIRHGLAIGHGHGPTNHFWFLDDAVALQRAKGEA